MKLSNIKAIAKVAKNTIVKHSPEILMGIGGITFVTTVVLASKETLTEEEILVDHDVEMECLKFEHDVEGTLDDKAYKKSKFNVYKDTACKTVVNYTPAIIFGTTSLACFFGAFGIMRKRYSTLVVAYTTLEESFRRYRERVIEARGAEEDVYYLTGAKPKELTVKGEDGKKTKTKVLTLPDGSLASPYAFKFSKYKENGDLNNQWTEDQMSNLSYVLGQQDYANNMLYLRNVFDSKHRVKVRGSWMLNETRDLLGEDPTPTGAVVGNRYSNGEPGCNGYIDYGVIESTEIDPATGKSIPCLIINPNVDGMIYDLLSVVEKVPFEPSYTQWGEDVRV